MTFLVFWVTFVILGVGSCVDIAVEDFVVGRFWGLLCWLMFGFDFGVVVAVILCFCLHFRCYCGLVLGLDWFALVWWVCL